MDLPCEIIDQLNELDLELSEGNDNEILIIVEDIEF